MPEPPCDPQPSDAAPSPPGAPPEPAFAQLYRELHDCARRVLAGSAPHGRAAQATSLVHEAWVRIARARPELATREAEFLAYAATSMRSILVDRARRRARQDDAQQHLSQMVLADGTSHRDVDVLAVDDALRELGLFDPPMARAVELRFFGGLDLAVIANLLGMPMRTFERNWRATRAWLFGRLS